ncbi:hypothetical protein COCC4DRAFT_66129 [Bipolaris maydis ATCC 48331]|uniref:Uncharacterized protein n=2 Tax=Cochliobolus heterostrophus TaxID=5016 RepID=M2UND4_COCH5|nr:uncharacterized protein COCC4DRAFT_66129 [Bipolaris maydis ATCC 48331]EMD89448.1 hypothetical protein COCHEDRAFT_1032477 [Bipolaris maydis C5]KAH7552766.1 hypothetical protein BM1_08717 [Bipolaris maydis]ENH99703.1 hypothetical protein COCC4DRAFT_66129 [Bipolaris maydis ATCC 48331]KAJ5057297.1 hypothetical protein J3E74DRAFT_293708 [Bipolaris maydis]KAJ6265215.1 hypothetical protein PSV08DRAFT_252863 [Bipolaris maydis]
MERVRKICTLCKIERQFEHSTRRGNSCPIPRPSRGHANPNAQKGRTAFAYDTTRTNAPLKKRNTLRKKNRNAAMSTQGAAKDRSATCHSTKEDTGVAKSAWLRTWLNKLPITTCPKPPTTPPSSTSPPPRKATSVDLSRIIPFRCTEKSPTSQPTNTTAPTAHRTRIPLTTKSSSIPNLSRHLSLSKKPTHKINTTTTTPSTPTKLQKRAPAPPRPKSTTTTTTALRPTPAPPSSSTTTTPMPLAESHPEQPKGSVVVGDGRNSTAYLTITAAATAGEEEEELEMNETRRVMWEYWNVHCRFLVEEWSDD